MSILKQVLSDAFDSVFRKPSTDGALNRPKQTTGTRDTSARSGGSDGPTAASPGMKTVILNWNRGENDPFTVFNKTISQYLHACGKNVEVIEITETDWVARLAKLVPAGVEFAFTWQGLGSRAAVAATGVSIWEHFKIPLICIHGDHPCHMPLNHELENPYCFHLYTNADFARYSNRHFRRQRGASVIDIPQLHREVRLQRRAGDYFVVAKNINDPAITENSWRQRLPKPAFDAFMMAAETLKTRLANEAYVEIHDVLDELIVQHGLEWLAPAAGQVGYHDYHSQLDHYLRSYKSMLVVTSLRDFPVRIYGRGWDRIAESASTSHIFEPGRNMADSQDLYYTRFGLVDVSPSKSLHDRTRRAMANEGAFLSSANLEESFDDITRFDRLFFSFRTQELPDKCAAVLRDPEAHLAVAQQFSRAYNERFHFKNFVNRIDQLAKMASMS
jgi:hypothetical protein